MCGKYVLVIPVLVSLIAYRYIQFMPSGAMEPFNQIMTLTNYRISDDIFYLKSLFGYSEIQLRRNYFESSPRPEPDKRVMSVDEYFDGVKVRIYRPKGTENKVIPALVYYHGGGWKYFSVDSYDPLTRNISLQANIAVVSVDYRLMPEQRFPVQFEDCIKATEYLFRNAEIYKVDPKRIGIAGDSAGGNLAAAVALKFSKEPKPDLPKLKLQVLLYPLLQAFDFNLPSYREYPDKSSYCFLHKDIIVDTANMYAFGDQASLIDMSKNKHASKETREKFSKFVDPGLLPTELKDRGGQTPSQEEPNVNLAELLFKNLTNPYIWPLMATDKDLEKLPKTYITVTEYDVLRDDGLIYAERLKRAIGENVEMKYWKGLEHGLYNNYNYKYHSLAIDLLTNYLARNL